MNNKIILIGSATIIMLWLTNCKSEKRLQPESERGIPVKVQKTESMQEYLSNGYIGIVEESIS